VAMRSGGGRAKSCLLPQATSEVGQTLNRDFSSARRGDRFVHSESHVASSVSLTQRPFGLHHCLFRH